MLTDTEKLNQIRDILDAPTAPIPAPVVVVPAYERPELPAAQVEHTDGRTYNSDGSVWTISNGHFKDQPAGQPYRTDYGYISPVKTPLVWAEARKLLAEPEFNAWEAVWKANPFAIYKVDLEGILREGKMPMNFMLFSMFTQSSTTFVQ